MRRAVSLGLLVALAACGRTGSAGAPSGIEGTVMAGPQCPVVRTGSPCPDKPVATDLRILTQTGSTVTTIRSGADGRFRVSLDPGAYVIDPIHRPGSPFLFGRPVTVRVQPHRFSILTLEVDTGIR